MKEQVREDPNILAAAERQMRARAMHEELQDRTIAGEAKRRATEREVCFVTITREAGAGGSMIAQHVGRRLGWRVFDKNLLDQVADCFHIPRIMLDLVDETPSNWVYDVLGTWMDRKLVSHEKFVAYLSRVVLMASRCGHAVFVGRGAQFILPRREVFAVHCIASPNYRLQRIMEQMKFDETHARRLMLEQDQGRCEFVKRFFHHDSSDPHLYDMVINADHFGTTGAAEKILAAIGR